MSIIYALSDIHGYLDSFRETMRLIDLQSSSQNKVIFVGDYIDEGPQSCQVLLKMMELEKQNPEQVIVLMGNHEEMFLDWLFREDELSWLSQDVNFTTTKSFFTPGQFNLMSKRIAEENMNDYEINDFIISQIKNQHIDLLNWLYEKSKQPRYYETENQIYVHAGICEVDEELWKHATADYEFTNKYPAETGPFYKDIIAGHISSAEVANNDHYVGKVYWDQQSHYFIDGHTSKSNTLPLLKYNTNTQRYSSFQKDTEGNWVEYFL